MKHVLVTVAALATMSGTAVAQSHYAGLEQRSIKALSTQQIDDLKNGRGMGLALAAELNGYPGPSHVLEHADRLGLTLDQKQSVQRLFDAMKQESVPLGVKLVEQEQELDRQFASRTVTPDTLKATTSAIAVTQGELRESHLKYHLSTAALLTQSQMQQYAALRGYQNKNSDGRHHDGGHQRN
jgi:hypothetical protein